MDDDEDIDFEAIEANALASRAQAAPSTSGSHAFRTFTPTYQQHQQQQPQQPYVQQNIYQLPAHVQKRPDEPQGFRPQPPSSWNGSAQPGGPGQWSSTTTHLPRPLAPPGACDHIAKQQRQFFQGPPAVQAQQSLAFPALHQPPGQPLHSLRAAPSQTAPVGWPHPNNNSNQLSSVQASPMVRHHSQWQAARTHQWQAHPPQPSWRPPAPQPPQPKPRPPPSFPGDTRQRSLLSIWGQQPQGTSKSSEAGIDHRQQAFDQQQHHSYREQQEQIPAWRPGNSSSMANLPPNNVQTNTIGNASTYRPDTDVLEALGAPPPLRKEAIMPPMPQPSRSRQNTCTTVGSSKKTTLVDLTGDADTCTPSETEVLSLDAEGLMRCNTTTGGIKADPEAALTWIYPRDVPERSYQVAAITTALLQNTLVCLPTGLGKTMIAAVVMHNFARWFPKGKVVFVAPTRPLVSQQIVACQRFMGMHGKACMELTGRISKEKRKEIWHSDESRVFFCTPQTFWNDVKVGICPYDLVTCVVVDECHRAVGQAEIAQALRFMRGGKKLKFRVLGLSATPGSSDGHVQEVISNLGTGAVLFRSDKDADVAQYVYTKRIELQVVESESEGKSIREPLLASLQQLVGHLSRAKLYFGMVSAEHVSRFALLKALQALPGRGPSNHARDMFRQASVLADLRDQLDNHGCHAALTYLQTKLSEERSIQALHSKDAVFAHFVNSLQRVCASGGSGPRMRKLVEMLRQHFDGGSAEDGQEDATETSAGRAIVFTSLRDSVSTIVEALQAQAPLIRARAFVGQGGSASGARSRTSGPGMNQKEQKQALQEFRNGTFNVLVATCIGEEGLDIPDVDLIICYDATVSPTRAVQRHGRTGRHREGRIVYILGEGKEEEHYRDVQENAARLHAKLREAGRNFELAAPKDNPRMLPRQFQPRRCDRRVGESPLKDVDMSAEDGGVVAVGKGRGRGRGGGSKKTGTTGGGGRGTGRGRGLDRGRGKGHCSTERAIGDIGDAEAAEEQAAVLGGGGKEEQQLQQTMLDRMLQQCREAQPPKSPLPSQPSLTAAYSPPMFLFPESRTFMRQLGRRIAVEPPPLTLFSDLLARQGDDKAGAARVPTPAQRSQRRLLPQHDADSLLLPCGKHLKLDAREMHHPWIFLAAGIAQSAVEESAHNKGGRKPALRKRKAATGAAANKVVRTIGKSAAKGVDQPAEQTLKEHERPPAVLALAEIAAKNAGENAAMEAQPTLEICNEEVKMAMHTPGQQRLPFSPLSQGQPIQNSHDKDDNGNTAAAADDDNGHYHHNMLGQSDEMIHETPKEASRLSQQPLAKRLQHQQALQAQRHDWTRQQAVPAPNKLGCTIAKPKQPTHSVQEEDVPLAKRLKLLERTPRNPKTGAHLESKIQSAQEEEDVALQRQGVEANTTTTTPAASLFNALPALHPQEAANPSMEHHEQYTTCGEIDKGACDAPHDACTDEDAPWEDVCGMDDVAGFYDEIDYVEDDDDDSDRHKNNGVSKVYGHVGIEDEEERQLPRHTMNTSELQGHPSTAQPLREGSQVTGSESAPCQVAAPRNRRSSDLRAIIVDSPDVVGAALDVQRPLEASARESQDTDPAPCKVAGPRKRCANGMRRQFIIDSPGSTQPSSVSAAPHSQEQPHPEVLGGRLGKNRPPTRTRLRKANTAAVAGLPHAEPQYASRQHQQQQHKAPPVGTAGAHAMRQKLGRMKSHFIDAEAQLSGDDNDNDDDSEDDGDRYDSDFIDDATQETPAHEQDVAGSARHPFFHRMDTASPSPGELLRHLQMMRMGNGRAGGRRRPSQLGGDDGRVGQYQSPTDDYDREDSFIASDDDDVEMEEDASAGGCWETPGGGTADTHDDHCGACGGRKGELLLCDGRDCKTSMHVHCAGLSGIPVGDWFCDACKQPAPRPRGPKF